MKILLYLWPTPAAHVVWDGAKKWLSAWILPHPPSTTPADVSLACFLMQKFSCPILATWDISNNTLYGNNYWNFQAKIWRPAKLYILKLEEGTSDLEIKRETRWSHQQLRRHQAQAFMDGYKRQDSDNYAVVALSEVPPEIKKLFKNAPEKAILKFEIVEEKNNGVIVTVI